MKLTENQKEKIRKACTVEYQNTLQERKKKGQFFTPPELIIKMKKRFVALLLFIIALLFISCDNGDYESGPIVEEPTFGTLVYVDSDGNIHPWSEDGDFTGMQPIIIED